MILSIDLFKSAFARLFADHDKAGEDIRNVGLARVAMLGAPFLIWRTISLSKQVQIMERADFNEKM